MIKAMDVLLQRWGVEHAAPAWEAPVRSPLGDTEQWMGGGRATGGEGGVGPVVAYVEHSRVYGLVDDALRAMSAPREEGGLGGRGRVLYTLAKVRYVHAGEMPAVAAQLAELKISKNTYRAQLDELHGWLEPRVAEALRGAAVVVGKQYAKRLAAARQADKQRVEVLGRQREQARSAALGDRSSVFSVSKGIEGTRKESA
ncbi:MAG: hypothetical protein KAX48_00710 [Aeromonas sp.]|nr:hypothetical protein [Aeromonas sp.]